jgi:hypothetical protein
MTLAAERQFRLHWTDEIEREWLEALARNRPDLDPNRLRRTANAMRNALPGACLADHGGVEGRLLGTDDKDRHVTAAAIKCAPSSLVTWNLRHFNEAELTKHGVSLRDPDDFLCRTFDRDPDGTLAATARSYTFLKQIDGRPTWSEYVDMIERDRLVGFASRQRKHRPKNSLEDDTDEMGNVRGPN